MHDVDASGSLNFSALMCVPLPVPAEAIPVLPASFGRCDEVADRLKPVPAQRASTFGSTP